MSEKESGPIRRLLVVDDEPIVGKRLRQVFTKIGFEIEIYTDSASALAAIAERDFAVVVTDLKMEGIDGIEVLKRVRRRNPATQVIIITGYARAGHHNSPCFCVSMALKIACFSSSSRKGLARKAKTPSCCANSAVSGEA